MKQAFHESLLPADATLISCSSHEERCLGIIGACRDWAPRKSVVLGYEDHDRRGEKHHAVMLSAFRRNCSAEELPVTCIEGRVGPTDRFFEILSERRDRPLVVDMSVLSKGHLLRLLRCIDDWGMWGQLWAVYSEPEDYEIAGRAPAFVRPVSGNFTAWLQSFNEPRAGLFTPQSSWDTKATGRSRPMTFFNLRRRRWWCRIRRSKSRGLGGPRS